MHAKVSCHQISYALWRMQVFRCLFCDAKPKTGYSPIFLRQTYSGRGIHSSVKHRQKKNFNHHDFNEGTKGESSNEYLDLSKDVPPAAAKEATDLSGDDGGKTNWSPLGTRGQQDMQDLVASLKEMTVQAQRASLIQDDDEHVPFQTLYQDRLYTAKRRPRETQQNDEGRQDPPQSLPKSPLWRRRPPSERPPKQQPTAEESKTLKYNPWAQILSSPIRQCQGTNARAPTDLLVDFSMADNPNDGQIYLMPHELGNMEGFMEMLPSGDDLRPKVRRKLHDEGTKIRILPHELLVESLTKHLSFFDFAEKKSVTRLGMVAKAMIPGRWSKARESALAFQRASREYFDAVAESESGTQNRATGQIMPNLDLIQWKADLADRMLNIMRQRVLLALDGVGNGCKSGRMIHRRMVVALPVPMNGRFDIVQGKLVEAEVSGPMHVFWNDMGDIEDENEISGSKKKRNDAGCPPIAVRPTEILDVDPDTSSKQQEIRAEDAGKPEWLSSSFFLHIGSSLSSEPTTTNQSDSTERTLSTLEPLPDSFYMPRMVAINDVYRVPVFDLDYMLGSDWRPTLSKLLSKHAMFSLAFWQDFNEHDVGGEGEKDQKSGDHYLLVKGLAPGSGILIRELWQLWRYMGGNSHHEASISVDELSPSQAVQRLSPGSWKATHKACEVMLFGDGANTDGLK